jgi:CRP-like cAMP-binding protein
VTDNNDILYVGDEQKTIYFYDEDIDLLKKIGNKILDTYEDYQVIASDNLQDVKDELLKTKPSVLILSLSDGAQNIKDFFDFIRMIRSDILIKNIPIIVLGHRNILEKESRELAKWEVELVPKAIRVPFFMGVLASCLSRAASVDVDIVTIKAGEHLFSEGDKASSVYIVKSGSFKVYREISGEIFNLGIIDELEIIGEMSIVDHTPRSASAQAISDSEVYTLNIGNIESFLKVQPFWLGMILKSVILRLRQTNDKLAAK